jgi:hypothetical protein
MLELYRETGCSIIYMAGTTVVVPKSWITIRILMEFGVLLFALTPRFLDVFYSMITSFKYDWRRCAVIEQTVRLPFTVKFVFVSDDWIIDYLSHT